MVSNMPEFAPGPLSAYRKLATFDWKKMKVLIEGADRLLFKQNIYDTLANDPLFHDGLTTATFDEQRRINHLRWRRLQEYKFVTPEDFYTNQWKINCLVNVLETYNQGLSARYFLSMGVFYSTILSMGTERHRDLLEMTETNQIVGCFCLTELSHGSNTKAIRTTATFDRVTDSFILHSPDIEAAKCWAGNLGQSATHAVVFAQLIMPTKNGVNSRLGLHAFVVPVRDLQSLRPMPGVTIGDMGEKPGAWNAVENGWAMFNHYRIPRVALLNRSADVTSDGVYTSPHKTVRSRQSASLGPLSIGRVGIVHKGVLAMQFASVIAIRYSAVRRQFGPTDDADELPVIEYPLQQFRLFPYLAAAYAVNAFAERFSRQFSEYLMRMVAGDRADDMEDIGREIHALSTCAKPVSTWIGVQSLGEARVACGGHGFLKASRLNDLRNDFDPSQTFEGENHMLLQQTANYLLSLLDEKRRLGKSIRSPMETVNFLDAQIDAKTSSVFRAFSADTTKDILEAYRWLIVYLLRKSNEKISHLQTNGGMDAFSARNETQVYHCHTLAMAYAEHTIIAWFRQFIIDDVSDVSLRMVLNQLCDLYALWSIEKHTATLYIGGYCTGSQFGDHIRQSIVDRCKTLKSNAIALVDTIAPPDFILKSALGHSDGDIYNRLMTSMIQTEGSMQRPDWWSDLVAFLHSNRPTNNNSKL